MPIDAPWVRLVLGAVTSLLLLLGVVGAVTTAGQDDSLLRAGDAGAGGPGSVATTVVGSAEGGAPGAAAGRPDGATAAGGGATAAGAGATGPIAAPVGRSPKAGTYAYRLDVDDGKETYDVSWKVEDAGKSGEETRVLMTAKGGNSTRIEHASFKSDGYLIRLNTFDSGGGPYDCDWEPDVVEFRFPLATGLEWANDARCKITVASGTADARQTDTAKVTGTEQVDVGGEKVVVWVIERTRKSEFVGGGNTVIRETVSRELFAPSHGLVVLVTGTETLTEPNKTTKAKTHLELDKLTPS